MILELPISTDITLMSRSRQSGHGHFFVEETFMSSSVMAELDLIEELRLRRWAREHYVPRSQRQMSWHPVVHDEMGKKDLEARREHSSSAYHDWMAS